MKDLGIGTHNVPTGRTRSSFAILLVILTIIGGLFCSATNATAADTVSLVVKLVDGLTPADQAAVIARNGGVETSSVPALRLHVVSVPTADQPLVQQNYQADTQVVSVEVNKTRKAEAIPTDANYGVQWALSKIGWESVFGTVAPTGTATLALLDTGIDATHPDLAGKVIPGTSILDGSNGLSDPSGHGTWLAGIAAAATDNGTGIAGIAFGGVQVMPVSVLNAGGIGQDSDIIAGIVWAVDHGADVILMGFSNPDFSQNLQDAIDYAWSKGAVLVAATGNDGVITPTFPAGDRGVIGVSATDQNDLLGAVSNYGQDTFLAAPGTDIYTTGPNGGYSYISGTSASSAFVAGAAAFMKAVDPTLTNGIIVGRLARSADAIGTAGDPNNPTMFGNGRLNMANALADTGTAPVQPAGTPGGGGPFVGPYAAAARNFTVSFAGTGNGSVIISVNTGTVSFATTGTNKCSGTGNNTASATITASCSSLQSSENSATVTLSATPSVSSYFGNWSAGSGGFSSCSGSGTCANTLPGGQSGVTATFNTKTPLTPSFSASKTYDGTISATASFTGFTPGVGNDDVSVTYTSATFDNKNVGTGKTVTISGLSLTGTDAYKYTLNSSTATTTANITAKDISTVTGITASNKVYDGNTSATLNTTAAGFTGMVTGDVLTVASASGAFSDKMVGNGKTVSITAITLGGADAANYNLTSTTATTTANITAKDITITGITADNKVYDGNTSATLNSTAAGFTGMVTGDILTVASASGAFSDKMVGNGKTVNITAITLGGADAGNYNLTATTATTTANITARPLTVTATGVNKQYDGTTTATVTLGDDRVSGDIVTDSYTSASFADKMVGNDKTISVSGISISGTDAGNYTFSTTATTSANITALHITGSFTASNKIYDGNNTASVLTRTLSGAISGDAVSLTGGTATFADKKVADGKTVTLAGASLAGGDAGNYVLDSVGTTTANITALHITGSFTASNKIYDGNNTATVLTRSLSGAIGGDAVTLNDGTATFADKKVADGKTVTIAGASLAGDDAGNYVLDSVGTTTANITARPLTITATGVNKQYDGTTTATVTLGDDRVSGDVFTDSYTSASFADKMVGNDKTISVSGISISGTDAGNYTFSTTATTSANITARPLTVTATGVNKFYDGTTAATVTLSDDRVSGDVFTDSYTSASFADKNVGNGKAVSVSGISTSGTDAGNYTFNTTTTTTANITAKDITTVTGITATNKVYDGNTSATLNTTAAGFTGMVAGDILTVASASGAFSDKMVGNGKTVNITAITLGGADAGNYNLTATTATTTANITARPLTVTATGVNKQYDGTAAATVTLGDDRVSGDIFTDSYTSASFADKNVGNGKTVSVSGISISGTDAGNYTFNTTATTTANITQLPITVTTDAKSKTYGDADPALTYIFSPALVYGDSFSGALTRAAGENVGQYDITQNTLALSSNYILNFTGAKLTINKKAASVTPDNANKFYGDADPAFTGTLTGFLAGDNVTATYSRTAGETVAGSPYTISATLNPAGVLGNYNITYNTASFTIKIWTLKGFYQPVDMSSVTTFIYNTVKNGSTVPFKFEVFSGATELTDTSKIKFNYAQTNCSDTAITEDIETTATGGTSLRYDTTDGQFVYNWKTPNTAGKCYRVTMTTQDGSSLQAYFKLK